MEDDRLVDREVEPLDIGELLGASTPGSSLRCSMIGDLAAARRLLRAQRGDDVGARLLGPVGARLDHSAGGQRSDGDVGPQHQQLVIALRRRELDVGILPRLRRSRSATRPSASASARPNFRITDPSNRRTARASPTSTCHSKPERS